MALMDKRAIAVGRLVTVVGIAVSAVMCAAVVDAATPRLQSPQIATSVPPKPSPSFQAPATQAPATSAPATSAPPTQAPAAQAPATSAPPTQAPAAPGPATSAPTGQTPTSANGNDGTTRLLLVLLAGLITFLLTSGFRFYDGWRSRYETAIVVTEELRRHGEILQRYVDSADSALEVKDPPALRKVGWKLVESRPRNFSATLYSSIADYYEFVAEYSELSKKQLDLLTVADPEGELLEIVSENLLESARHMICEADALVSKVARTRLRALYR